ncbi:MULTISPECIES: hypothetical protein [unclassified Mesorhizobium]|uniref:hypothetical protein n=1 Tax=unclassified Mesorhizobium TaxID=325217 RepID=UPI0033396419
MQLVDQGYTMVPGVKANNTPRSLFAMAFVAKRQSVASRQFGCSGQYWLDE